ncbi:MAG: hypothetical protein KBC26_01970 [Candidatus Pacebacteria bacterium]|nr:hypothetical protein [Candidatus Paceibacterota bacterium]
MKQSQRIGIVFAVLIAAFLVGWFFFVGGVKEDKSTQLGTSQSIQQEGIIKQNISIKEGATSSPKSVSESSNNVTGNITQDITDQLLSSWDGSADISSLSQSLAAVNIKNLGATSTNILELYRAVKDSDIRIVDDISDARKKEYGDAYATIVEKEIGLIKKGTWIDTMVDDVFLRNNTTPAKEASDMNRKIVSSLKTLPVPRVFTTFHKQNIIFFENLQKIFDSFIVFDKDPLKASLGLDALPDVLKDWVKIQSQITAY